MKRHDFRLLSSGGGFCLSLKPGREASVGRLTHHGRLRPGSRRASRLIADPTPVTLMGRCSAGRWLFHVNIIKAPSHGAENR
ncbi:MAG: hypothetical protein PVG84_12210 [Desulfobacterales bacterium]